MLARPHKEDLQKTKMVREHISLINDIKEEKEKKPKGAYKESSTNNRDIDDFFFCDLCRYKCQKESILKNHKNIKHVINAKALKCNKCRYKIHSLSDMIKNDQKKQQDKKLQNVTSYVLVRSCLMNLMYEIMRGGLLPLVGSLYIID